MRRPFALVIAYCTALAGMAAGGTDSVDRAQPHPIAVPRAAIEGTAPASAPGVPADAAPFPALLTEADFARRPDYENVRVSPDGLYLAVTKSQAGWRSLVVLHRGTLEISHIEHFNPPNEVADFTWVKDHRLLVTLATHVGTLDAPVLTGE